MKWKLGNIPEMVSDADGSNLDPFLKKMTKHETVKSRRG
jgi:hypothetical protein